jgi:glycosyltransferase involved in cell wall biosynthesis
MGKNMIKLFSVIIPVYRQKNIIYSNLKRIKKILDELLISYELIVVIDGDEDRSYNEALKIKSKHCKIFKYITNHGKGYAIRYGMAQSKGDVVGFLDAGGDLNETGLRMLLDYYQWYNADIVIGSKRHPESKVKYPFFRKILSIGYQLLVRILFGLNIRDSQVGLKLYRRQVLEEVLPRLLVKRFAFDIEILAVAWRLGYRNIVEAPIELDFTGVSTIASTGFWRVVLNVLWDTFAVFYRLKILRYYDKSNSRKWRYDPELNFKINTGEL